jgi:hypothetical protein
MSLIPDFQADFRDLHNDLNQAADLAGVSIEKIESPIIRK